MFFKNKIAPHIPNFITILNLISGAIGIFLVLKGKVIDACYMMYLAALFDFLDGLMARILKASSEIGKSLDSLADMISFGLLPATIIFSIIQGILSSSDPSFKVFESSLSDKLLLASSLLIAAFSALRLANFNTDSRQTYGFIGVPTPAVGILVSSFPFILEKTGSLGAILLSKLYIIIPLTLVLSLLMVSELPMISLKFKTYGFSENIFKYLLILISVICIVIWGIGSVPIIFLCYLLFSFAEQKIKQKEGV